MFPETKKDVQIVIALMGPKGCGKDTVADYSIANLQASGKMALANGLKRLCSQVFNLPLGHFMTAHKNRPFERPVVMKAQHVKAILQEIRDKIPETVLTRSQFKPHKVGAQLYVGRTFITPRELLQFVGTDLIQAYCTYFHSYTTFNELKGNPGVWFITDLRFRHEAKAAAEIFPLFYPLRITGRNEVAAGAEEHASESDWKLIEPFATIDNSKEGLDFLYKSILPTFQAVKEHASAKIAAWSTEEIASLFARPPIVATATPISGDIIKSGKCVFRPESQVPEIEIRDMD